ncbi:4-hydroxybenzoyl-CoA thioesterase [Pokkaliibacter plantistimulans]|uniref:4-hydroxybenzoyl-CoA thioesterase n=1 Tax=Pokkaliibacter plantistimulans TaxID=1635171 RepID=A0ABX5LZB6_9GAMM|nr:acyl-CoA thioesterase [Pokkaliibacter plantistimulans]PXF30980.1 4-hydroxybenzoyl-CoA thioesterase [Pokkaliibacter plantistimulans]
MHKAEVELEIPFHDVDMMEVAWHGHYVRYLELARCKLLDSIDYNYPQMKASGYAWPVIELNLRYARPLRFQQRIRVEAQVVEWENRLKVAYTIRDAVTNERLTRAHTVQVAVEIASGEMLFASPAVLLQQLGVTL